MAGRGRGKPAMSFSMDQLGASKGESLPAPVLQPSPCYPPLERKPPPIEMTAEMSYLVELKRDFTEYMRESPNYVTLAVKNEDIERYCEDFEEANDDTAYEAYHDWDLMPAELRTSKKPKIPNPNVGSSRKKKEVDIAKKLAELEKKESTQQTAEEEEKEEKDEENDEEKETEERVKEEEEDEMDDGTDYVLEYFENGDNYYSEDDNDDDQCFDG
ncbi:PREDICTED: DNA-directed RNA polymerase III subunit RPC7-like isoform X2 [Wasmannia auropunctata]|nr:PREDICTED: DNA-directed RNA polymerase III subunit RPC7-like isoform X2 [Wasmannia auropunctata]